MANQLLKKFIGDNQVDGSKILLEQGQSLKVLDSTGAEVSLIELGASDEVIVNGSQVSLKADLDQEIIDRAAGDASTLSSAEAYTDGEIGTLSASVSASISAEEAARIAADAATLASSESYTDGEITALETSVNASISAGDSATLASAQSYTDAEVLAEENARIAADQSLQSQIDAISGGGSGSLSALQSELDATQVGAGLEPDGSWVPPVGSTIISSSDSIKEALQVLDVEAQNVADNGIFKNVAAAINTTHTYQTGGITLGEDSNGISASDRSIPGGNFDQSMGLGATELYFDDFSVDGYTSVKAGFISLTESNVLSNPKLPTAPEHVVVKAYVDAADANLQSQIDNVLSNVDGAALDSLTEIVSAFQAADASLNGAITALSTGLSADIDAEEAARIAADSALQGEIDAEEIARAAADTTLQNNINSEASARQSADDALDVRVDVLESVTNKKQKFAMSNQQTSITLDHAPIAGSLMIFVDQVPMHESIDAGASDDWSVSGTTVTFINDYSATGNKKMQANDTVYVKYQYLA